MGSGETKTVVGVSTKTVNALNSMRSLKQKQCNKGELSCGSGKAENRVLFIIDADAIPSVNLEVLRAVSMVDNMQNNHFILYMNDSAKYLQEVMYQEKLMPNCNNIHFKCSVKRHKQIVDLFIAMDIGYMLCELEDNLSNICVYLVTNDVGLSTIATLLHTYYPEFKDNIVAINHQKFLNLMQSKINEEIHRLKTSTCLV